MDKLLIEIGTNIINVIKIKVNNAIELSPYVLGALALFLFGWVLAEMSAKAIRALGHKLHLEKISEKIGLTHFLEQRKAPITPTELVARSFKGYLIFLFFIEATKIARMTEVSEFLSKVIGYIPEVLIAVFIMLVGIRIGNTVKLLISTSLTFAKSNTANVLGYAANYTVITFAVLAALSQLEIAEILIQSLFIGFVSMLTLAGGLAFGLGGKDVVHELLEDIKKVELKEIRKEIRQEVKQEVKEEVKSEMRANHRKRPAKHSK